MTTQFDAKLEHVLTHFLGATGADHHIQKACINKQILNFEDFTDGCTLENIKTFQQDDGTNNLVQAFSSVKLTLVTNVILYYDFLQHDNQEVLAEDPINWVKADFRKWRRNPIVNTNTNAGTATVTTAATAAVVKQKQQDDSFLSWRRSRKDEKDYPVLNNNREFIEWDVKFERKIRSDKMYRMIDLTFYTTSLEAGSDTELYQRQKNFFTTILECVLQTREGKRLTRKYPDDPRKVWRLHEAHSQSLATASSICTGLS